MSGKGLEEVFDEIGVGRWQVSFQVISAIAHMVMVVQIVGPNIINAPVAFRCFHSDNVTNQNNITTFFNNNNNSSNTYYDSQCLSDTSHLPNLTKVFIKSSKYVAPGVTDVVDNHVEARIPPKKFPPKKFPPKLVNPRISGVVESWQSLTSELPPVVLPPSSGSPTFQSSTFQSSNQSLAKSVPATPTSVHPTPVSSGHKSSFSPTLIFGSGRRHSNLLQPAPSTHTLLPTLVQSLSTPPHTTLSTPTHTLSTPTHTLSTKQRLGVSSPHHTHPQKLHTSTQTHHNHHDSPPPSPPSPHDASPQAEHQKESPPSPPSSPNHSALHPTGLASCPYVQYDQSVFFNTFVTSFDLVCERENVRPLFQLLYSVGVVHSGPIGGAISARYGARRVVLGGNVVLVLSVAVMMASPSYQLVIFARFVAGLCSFTLAPAAYSLAIETVPQANRNVFGMLMGTPFSLTIVVLAGIGYLLRTWRLTLFIGTAPAFILIPLAYLTQDSPRWLVQQGRGKEAARALYRAAHAHKVTLSPTAHAILQGLIGNGKRMEGREVIKEENDDGNKNEKEEEQEEEKKGMLENGEEKKRDMEEKEECLVMMEVVEKKKKKKRGVVERMKKKRGVVERMKKKRGVVEEMKKKGVVERMKERLEPLQLYLTSPGMRLILLVMPAVWLMQTTLYIGLALNGNNYSSSNPFLYVSLSGLMDVSSILIATPINLLLGRRRMMCGCFLTSATLLLLELAVPAELAWLKWMMVMIGFFLSAAAYQVNFLFVPELLPTTIRTAGFGFITTMGTVGFILAPLVTDILAPYGWWVANVAFGSAGLVAGLLVPIMPETNGLPLPETLQDVEDRWRRQMEARRRSWKGGGNCGGGEGGKGFMVEESGV
ncbi:hypothetical protein Pcinc_031084 [Petrolisthes cinctipes]|uniref:Major facilitator superfamily (MFS) profile domain-containing protein n=1 Tax=Petrolisthes cinctipes TaxID=88211 RepID=A0AAE1EWT1_PETCI|nr:hypothetical protein Pcinc_031084 [Petrolisthes cinctipes]